jgi:hypothetical protein
MPVRQLAIGINLKLYNALFFQRKGAKDAEIII